MFYYSVGCLLILSMVSFVAQKILSLNKNIIACRIFAAGIQKPDEAFTFLRNLDFIDLITFGVASKEEITEDMEALKKF